MIIYLNGLMDAKLYRFHHKYDYLLRQHACVQENANTEKKAEEKQKPCRNKIE